MNKQQLKKDAEYYKRMFWATWVLGFIWILVSLWVISTIDSISYEKGFQDGQNNCTEKESITCSDGYNIITWNMVTTNSYTNESYKSKNYTIISCKKENSKQ